MMSIRSRGLNDDQNNYSVSDHLQSEKYFLVLLHFFASYGKVVNA